MDPLQKLYTFGQAGVLETSTQQQQVDLAPGSLGPEPLQSTSHHPQVLVQPSVVSNDLAPGSLGPEPLQSTSHHPQVVVQPSVVSNEPPDITLQLPAVTAYDSAVSAPPVAVTPQNNGVLTNRPAIVLQLDATTTQSPSIVAKYDTKGFGCSVDDFCRKFDDYHYDGKVKRDPEVQGMIAFIDASDEDSDDPMMAHIYSNHANENYLTMQNECYEVGIDRDGIIIPSVNQRFEVSNQINTEDGDSNSIKNANVENNFVAGKVITNKNVFEEQDNLQKITSHSTSRNTLLKNRSVNHIEYGIDYL